MHNNELKEEISTEELLANIAECSKNAGKRLATYWAVVLYGIITLAGITDKDIFLDTGVRLPLVNVTIPLTSFWIAFPIIVIMLFFLFTMLLYRLEELRYALPSKVRANGIRLYPWFWNIGRDSSGLVGWLVRWSMQLVIWLSVPFAHFLNMFSSSAMHSDWIGGYTGLWFVLGTYLIVIAFMQIRAVGKRAISGSSKKKINMLMATSIVALLVFGALAVVYKTVLRQYERTSIDVSYQVLVEKPAYDHPNAYWVDLSGRDFRRARLQSSVLRRAKLDNTDFRGADLSSAILDSSSFNNARLDSSDLSWTNLRVTDFSRAHMEYVNLRRANLESSNLKDASLGHANLEYARLYHAYLRHCNLSYAHLENANLQGSNLKYVNFHGAHLVYTDLLAARLDSADLLDANLSYADLERTAGLTVDQLSEAQTLYKVRNLRSALRKPLEQCCGYLFAHPDSIDRGDYPPFGEAKWPPVSLDKP